MNTPKNDEGLFSFPATLWMWPLPIIVNYFRNYYTKNIFSPRLFIIKNRNISRIKRGTKRYKADTIYVEFYFS